MNLPNGISIVICTYNGIKRLRPTLESISNQQITENISWELIIIDNASTDGTADFCMDLINDYGLNEKSTVLIESNQGCNHARLRGLQEAQFKWLLFCDDDNHLFPDYLENAWQILNSNPTIGILGGQGVPLFEEQKPVWFDKYSKSYAVGAQSNMDGKIVVADKKQLYSAGSFFRKDVLMKYYDNGFTAIMTGPNGKELTRGEDTEWCFMIQLAGYDLWFSSQLKFYHYMTKERLTWDYYLKLKAGIAAGESKLLSYHFFLKFKKPSFYYFFLTYIKCMVFYNIAWIQFKLRNFFQKSRYIMEEKMLGEVILKTKANTFNKDYLIASKQFKKIQKMLQCI